MTNCITKINESLHSFSKQELKIAKFILASPKVASEMTIIELANASNSSTATIVRFCNTLGYSGYRDFIKNFFHDVETNSDNKENNIYEIDLKSDRKMDIATTIKLVSKLNIESITNSLKVISEKDIKNAVNMIDKAREVKLFASSGSKVVAEDAQFKFERLGIDCQVYSDSHSQILAATIMKSNDVAILISYTGETSSIVESANYVKKCGAKTIGITRYGTNRLSQIVDVSIRHSSIGKGLRTYSTRSRVVQTNIIDIIYVAICQKRRDKLNTYYELFKDNPVDYDNNLIELEKDKNRGT